MWARSASSRHGLAAWAGDKIAADGPDLLSLAGGPRTLRVASAPRSGWSHPRVRSLEAASRTNTLEAKAARRRWVPDLELFAGYRTVAGAVSMGHGISLGLTVPLTFFDYGQGEAQRADAKSRFAEAKASRLRRAHTARMSAEAARLAELEKGLAALDQMVRDGLTLRKKARLLYSADEASIAELLDAYRVTEAVHQARIDAIEEILNARLEVMSAAGTHFNTALDKACGASPRRGPR